MKLYNALSQKLETFVPRRDPITIYVCGITPYDTTHLGHAFTYLTFDTLIRYLEYKGYNVRYVQNVTDIDDDILRKADEVGENWQKIGKRWTAHFIQDMQTLNVRPPDHFPAATDVIDEIIETVQQLTEAEVAYEVEGNVYFDVYAWPKYGRLSRLPEEKMLPIANERGNNPDDPNKKNPLDFVLWQAQAPGEPAWESPWGKGRPGWHIECSTMASAFLGATIDIHGGGYDLIFPHHESEIAQSECATGQSPFVRYWMHAAMVHHDGEKMSKSLGNLVMVRDLLETYRPDALRLYIANQQYRKIWSYDEAGVEQAEQLAQKLIEALSITGPEKAESALDPSGAQAAFEAGMDNDLDSPTALKALERLADQIVASTQNIQAAQNRLRQMSRVFGLHLEAEQPEARVLTGWGEHRKRFT